MKGISHNSLLHSTMKRSIKTAIIILILLSIISILLSCNYDFCHSFFSQLQSIKNSLNKKAMFCFFNAILLFLVKDFGFLNSSNEQEIDAPQRSEDFTDPKGENQQLPSSRKEIILQTKQVEKVDTELMEEEGAGGEMEELDIDELNRKFEEFIDKVKRERSMEALQKLFV